MHKKEIENAMHLITLQMNKQRKKIIPVRTGLFFLVMVIFIFSTLQTDLRACDERRREHDEIGNNCWGCPIEIEICNANIYLGSFLAGMEYTLPAADGNGNEIEFILYGDSKKRYDFSFSMNLRSNLGSGYAQITNWSWEKADYFTNGAYGSPSENRTSAYTNVRLYKPRGVNHCRAYAKFRITAKKLFVSSNAASGNPEFTITVSACLNM